MKMFDKKENNKNQKNAAASRVARKSKSRSTHKPIVRIISLFLALVMVFGVVVPTGLYVWNMFFRPSTDVLGTKNAEMERLMEELSKIAAETKKSAPAEDVKPEESSESEEAAESTEAENESASDEEAKTEDEE